MKRHIADIRLWVAGTDASDATQAYGISLYNDSESGATDSQVIENFLEDTWKVTQYVEVDDFAEGNTALIYRR
jgi:hypothetical protein